MLFTSSATTGDGCKGPVYRTKAKVKKANCERGKLFLVAIANVRHRASERTVIFAKETHANAVVIFLRRGNFLH